MDTPSEAGAGRARYSARAGDAGRYPPSVTLSEAKGPGSSPAFGGLRMTGRRRLKQGGTADWPSVPVDGGLAFGGQRWTPATSY